MAVPTEEEKKAAEAAALEEESKAEEEVKTTNPEAPKPKPKGKQIKVKANRILNLGKLERKGVILHFQKDEVKSIPYNKHTQHAIDHHIEVGLLKKVK